ncbi:unnamed protein product [Durusdinium trenchii]|uniref:Uncharacterized protein n=1 Tax=Durusdinium trenchii TaxID=1381693 RepID=A0ABP0MIR8_9DINO
MKPHEAYKLLQERSCFWCLAENCVLVKKKWLLQSMLWCGLLVILPSVGAVSSGHVWLEALLRSFGEPIVAVDKLLHLERSYHDLRLPRHANVSQGVLLVMTEPLQAAGTEPLKRVWDELPPNSLLAVPLRPPLEREVLELLRRLFFATQQKHWEKKPGPMPALSDTHEVCCIPAGCLAQKALSYWTSTSVHLTAARNYGRWGGRLQAQHPFFAEALKRRTDKVTYHMYELLYHRTLPRDLSHHSEPGCFLEIGFGCNFGGGGLSAAVWPVIFPGAKVHVLDNNGTCVRNLSPSWVRQQNYTACTWWMPALWWNWND